MFLGRADESSMSWRAAAAPGRPSEGAVHVGHVSPLVVPEVPSGYSGRAGLKRCISWQILRCLSQSVKANTRLAPRLSDLTNCIQLIHLSCYGRFYLTSDNWIVFIHTSGYRLDGLGIGVLFPAGAKDVTLWHRPDWLCCPVSCTMGTRVKRPGREIDDYPPSNPEVKNCGAIPSIPHTSPQEQLYLLPLLSFIFGVRGVVWDWVRFACRPLVSPLYSPEW
jgi:hypothetical protein